jgi:hypothetical protein
MSTKPTLIRETFPVGPLQCNCTIIGDPLTKKAIVVDPGGDHELILARLEKLGLQVVSIIHTHAHLDHFWRRVSSRKKRATLHTRKTNFCGTTWRCNARCLACRIRRCHLIAGWPTMKSWPVDAVLHAGTYAWVHEFLVF